MSETMVLKLYSATTLVYGTFASISRFAFDFTPTCFRCGNCSRLSAGTLYCRAFEEEVNDDALAANCKMYDPR